MLIGPVVGQIGGLYLMLLLPFVDVGLAQNAMFDIAPPAYAGYLPAHGAVRVLLDAAFTPSFDQWSGLLLGVAWLAGLCIAAASCSAASRCRTEPDDAWLMRYAAVRRPQG